MGFSTPLGVNQMRSINKQGSGLASAKSLPVYAVQTVSMRLTF